MTVASSEHASPRGRRFVVNILWNWMGVAAALVGGLLISPYLIRKLGPEAYGVWVLSFALVENYSLLDLGFRSATVKYVAHYWATGETERVNEILNTVIAFAAIGSSLVLSVIFVASRYVDRFFNVSPTLAPSFRTLVLLVSTSWCLGFVFNNFAASLEAVQRFDLYSQISVAVTVVRVGGTAILLYVGAGLVEIGILVITSQILGYAFFFLSFRAIFPQLHLSPRFATLATLRKMGSFGIHTFLVNISTMILAQSPALLIGHFLNAAFVGYYAAPNRLLQYSGEAVGRVGIITNANTAELQARGDTRALPQLAIFTNRYCVTLFMPIAIMLFVFGRPLFDIWIPSIAAFSAPLLPIMLTGYVIGVIGQFSSWMLLQGLGRHQRYAIGMIFEAALCVTGATLAVPRFGITGVAVVTSSLMILNRGLFTPWLVSRELRFSFTRFVGSTYGWPAIAGIPAFAVAMLLRGSVLPGHSWGQLAAAASIVAAVYLSVAFFACVPAEHRDLLRSWLVQRLSRLRTA
ncbi:MAG: oligosaccharide flippase family protein [Acidobacteriia bacterium]|nr:oligosaccharide flippase family protein [Terriglobia bacterium]